MNPPRFFLQALLRTAREPRLLGLLLGLHLLVALLSTLPLLPLVMSYFGHALSGRGQPFPSAEALIDLGRLLSRGGGAILVGSLGLGLGASFGLQLVLSGGIVSRLCSTERFSLARFAHDCVAQLGRNLRLLGWALLGLLPLGGLVGLAAVLLSLAHQTTLFTFVEGQSMLDDPLGGWSGPLLGGMLVLLMLWRSSFDLARVQLLAEDPRKTRRAAWRALRHMARSPGTLLGYALLSTGGLLGVIAAARLHAALPVTSTAQAVLSLLLAQVVVLVRLGASVATTAFAVEVHRTLKPEQEVKPVADAGASAQAEAGR